MSIDYFGLVTNVANRQATRIRHDQDQMERELADEATAEHTAAQVRGARVRAVAKRVAWELHAHGQLRGSHLDLERELKQALADELYPGVAVDL